MNRLRTRTSSNVEDQITAEIGFCSRGRPQAIRLVRFKDMKRSTVRVRIDGNRMDAKLTTAPQDAERDLATIGDQNLANSYSSVRHGKKGF